VLQHFHGLPITGHNGQGKMTKLIAVRFFWPNMRPAIRRWIAACACRKRKTIRQLQQGMMENLISPHPFHTIAIDYVTSLPKTEEGYTCMLTIIDLHSKWPMAFPVRTRSAEEAAEIIFKHVICRHGVPKRIISDQEGSFASAVCKNLCKRLGIQKIETTGWHPSGNGVLERWHRYLNSTITTFLNTKKDNWPGCIEPLLFAYRISVHDATHLSPFKILHGREAVLPTDVALGLDEDSSDKKRQAHWGNTVMGKIKDIWHEATLNQMDSVERNREMVDDKQKRGFIQYQPKDWVLLWDPEKPKRKPGKEPKYYKMPTKWQRRWSGPYQILKKVSNVNYTLAIPSAVDGKLLVNIARITPYYPWDDTLLDTTPLLDSNQQPLPVHDDSDNENNNEEDNDNNVDNNPPQDEPADQPTKLIPTKIGEIFLMHLPRNEEHLPDWGIARLTGKSGAYLIYQWYGNATNDFTKSLRPEWAQLNLNGSVRTTTTANNRPGRHIPYTCHETNTATYPRDVIFSGVKLTKVGSRIPPEILERLSKGTRVRWTLPN
jgi:hypothetical protein